MPFLKRYGATDMLDADQQLLELSELVLPVAFGIRWRQRVLLRAYLPPTLPVAAPDTEVVSFSGHSGLWLGRLCLPLGLPQVRHSAQIDSRRGRHA
jgi:hypothetical protein